MSRNRGLADRLRRLVTPAHDVVEPVAGKRLRLSGRGTRIPIPDNPIEIELGKERLHIQQDTGVRDPIPRDPTHDEPPEFIVFNPDRYFSGIGYALRLQSGRSLRISHEEKYQAHLFNLPREAFRRNFQVDHDGDSLAFRDPISELGTYVTVLPHPIGESALVQRRRVARARLIEIFGGAIDMLSPQRALDVIRRVNELLIEDPYRRLDQSGNPGGVVEIPAAPTPVIVGDLHANVDNLLKLLSEGALLQSLEEQTAVLVFLGDVAHPDREPLDYMDSSVLIMDFLFMLKLRFPAGVVVLRGNHESFSPELGKGGIPQALLWEKRLTELRGETYREQMARFYELSPVLALSPDFLACHAGPTRARVSIDDIVNIRRHPGLAHQLTWNRIRRGTYPHGYVAGDVRRFRKSLGLNPHLPFLVGHYPYADEGTLWLDVGGIRDHHVVYSSRPDKIGIFTRVDDDIVPLVLPAEPLLATLADASARASATT